MRDVRLGWVFPLLLLLITETAYVFFVSAGKMTDWPSYTTFNDFLAEGFRSGHLYLSVQPPPALLAAKDPFDGSNLNLWLWDTSLYANHYYLYWGPLPALLLAAFKTTLRWSTAIGDERCVFVAASVRLVAGALLTHQLWRRLFPRLPAVLPAAAILVFGFANPTPWMLARAAIYESAIDSAQACVALGLLLGFIAVNRSATGRSPRPWLVAAGATWGLTLACRVSLGPAVAVLLVATALLARPRAERTWRRTLLDLAAVGVPAVLELGALLLYNRARFGSLLDFGIRHQLTTQPFLTSRAWVRANVYSYLFRPLSWSCHFPFGTAPWNAGAKAFPGWLHLREGYVTIEPVAGAMYLVPWAWFGVLAVPLIAVQTGRRLWAWGSHGLDDAARARTWCMVAFSCAATLPLFATLPMRGATMRYLDDFAVGIVLLGTLGAFSLYELARSSVVLRRLVVALLLAAALLTIVLGAMQGFQGYFEHFKRDHNPRLWEWLVRKLSVC